MSLFQLGKFKSAAGLDLDWKIECDALTDADWDCIAEVARKVLPPFGGVYAVPTGGLRLANRLAPFRDARIDVPLVVDDVWTTGKSMLALVSRCNLQGKTWLGFVAFARGPLPDNVRAFMRMALHG